MPEGSVRCPNCHRIARADEIGALSALCPNCLQPLSPGDGNPTPIPPGREDAESVVTAWVDSFNARDLPAMLSRMSPHVDFHPIRFGGLRRDYRGHDGVRQWFAQLGEMDNSHRIDLAEVRPTRGADQTIAVGTVTLAAETEAPFWALSRVVDGLIVAAYHYLTDPDIMKHIDP